MTGVNQASPPRCCGPACYRSPHVASSDRPSREAGWRTLALDLPGHGRSPGPGRGFTMDECAQAAVQVLDATDVRAPVVVFGTSWGGFVAPRVAMLAPKRLSGMVVFNTSAERGTPFERVRATLLTKLLAIRALGKVTARLIVSGLLAPETQRRDPELGADLAEQFLTRDRRRFITTVRSSSGPQRRAPAACADRPVFALELITASPQLSDEEWGRFV